MAKPKPKESAANIAKFVLKIAKQEFLIHFFFYFLEFKMFGTMVVIGALVI